MVPKLRDLAGQRFRRWTVKHRLPSRNDKVWWHCSCECGTERAVTSDALLAGSSGSCGCTKHRRSPKFKYLAGRSVGRLTVTRFDGTRKRKTYWFAIWAGNLSNGQTRSCGCLNRERIAAQSRNSKHCVTHGLSATRQYQAWSDMKGRCHNPQHSCYSDYGGRGITVCDAWRESFEAFWRDMQDGYSDNLTLHRVDNDAGYSKENCVWATHRVQALCKRTTSYIETPIGRMGLVDAANHYGLLPVTLRGRIGRGVPHCDLFLPAQLQRGGRKRRL